MTPTGPLISYSPSMIDACERAIVYCSVDWSMSERQSRAVVRDVITRLRAASFPIAFDFITIQEDDPSFADWLALHVDDGANPRGVGMVLWLERGRCVGCEINAASVGVNALVQRTESLWKSSPAV